LNILLQAFWLIILNVYELYIARFIGGLNGGGVFVLIPIYVVELAEDKYGLSLINKINK